MSDLKKSEKMGIREYTIRGAGPTHMTLAACPCMRTPLAPPPTCLITMYSCRWEAFEEILKKPLPVTFRLHSLTKGGGGPGGEAQASALAMLRKELEKDLSKMKSIVSPVPWAPLSEGIYQVSVIPSFRYISVICALRSLLLYIRLSFDHSVATIPLHVPSVISWTASVCVSMFVCLCVCVWMCVCLCVRV